MHDSGKQNFIYLRLKDVDGKYIDIAGQRGVAPFAGDTGTQFISMRRVGLDGTSALNWTPTRKEDGQNYIEDGYRTYTIATPGDMTKSLP
jgi:hypothetical protein